MSDKSTEPSGKWKYVRPLKDSSIRWELFRLLCEIYPEGVSLDELVDATGHYKVDVIGVLIGYRFRYWKKDSLVGLGLVSCTMSMVGDKPVMMFTITQLGLEVRDYLKEFEFRSSSSTNVNLFKRLRNRLWKK
jgi:predicted transcriptional regulator with HTH domain